MNISNIKLTLYHSILKFIVIILIEFENSYGFRSQCIQYSGYFVPLYQIVYIILLFFYMILNFNIRPSFIDFSNEVKSKVRERPPQIPSKDAKSALLK